MTRMMHAIEVLPGSTALAPLVGCAPMSETEEPAAAAEPASLDKESASHAAGAAAPSLGGAHAHAPYISASKDLPELTFRAVVLGAILGVIFAASSVYL